MERPPLRTLPGERAGEGGGAGFAESRRFQGRIIGRSGGYRNLAVRGKKAAGARMMWGLLPGRYSRRTARTIRSGAHSAHVGRPPGVALQRKTLPFSTGD